MVPDQLEKEVEELRSEGLSVELKEAEGWIIILIYNYPLPRGYSRKDTKLLLKFPLSYPNGKPDMFWTGTDILLENGQVPQSAEQIEPALGSEWRRFSWHLQNWNPAVDNLKTYLEFVNNRLAKVI